jgi:tRNA A37 methylthiotransferase MiaB
VFFESDEEILTGEFLNIKITEARGYDLVGEIVKDSR